MSIIEVSHLTKFYGKSRGIVDVSFNVEEGEIFGFIGPNGAGKSTTIRLLLSLIHPSSGEGKVFGLDVTKHGPEIRRDIGYLPSEVFYYEGMKVIDLLKYSASFYEGDFTARMQELSELMELEMNRRISDLSYGNKKKVGIVQGLLHSPRLLFLDEPTSGLDPLMQRKFFDLIKAENQRGVTVFFSSTSALYNKTITRKSASVLVISPHPTSSCRALPISRQKTEQSISSSKAILTPCSKKLVACRWMMCRSKSRHWKKFSCTIMNRQQP